jgi:hypothetical protein
MTYKCAMQASRIRSPFILTHWDTEKVYVCLPTLSCKPKILRLGLSNDFEANINAVPPIETLSKPIFFPNSTTIRDPRILYRASESDRKDIFVLALDSHPRSSRDQGNERKDHNPDDLPQIYEWKIPKQGWRPWDATVDVEDSRLVEESKTYAQLRGNFLDTNRRFNVCVRNGLDWTRKAFLSCS